MRLVLVRHAAVTIRGDSVPREWHLSPEGRGAAEELARSPVFAGTEVTLCSTEPKAIATAQRIAAGTKARLRVEPDLREAERPLVDSAEVYRRLAQGYVRGEALDGWEEQAIVRRRMRDVLERLPANEDTVIVSHGLALTLLLAEILRIDVSEAARMWSDMRFPDVAVLEWPSGTLRMAFGESTEIDAQR
jgi:broad specificity phosphatase PhoE